jgi:hypothetical protein
VPLVVPVDFVHIAPAKVKPSGRPQQKLHAQHQAQVSVQLPYALLQGFSHGWATKSGLVLLGPGQVPFVELHVGAFLGAVRTEDAARPFQGAQHGLASLALVEKETGVTGHDLFFPVAAFGARNDGC